MLCQKSWAGGERPGPKGEKRKGFLCPFPKRGGRERASQHLPLPSFGQRKGFFWHCCFGRRKPPAPACLLGVGRVLPGRVGLSLAGSERVLTKWKRRKIPKHLGWRQTCPPKGDPPKGRGGHSLGREGSFVAWRRRGGAAFCKQFGGRSKSTRMKGGCKVQDI